MQHPSRTVSPFLGAALVLLCLTPVLAVGHLDGLPSLEVLDAMHSFFEGSSSRPLGTFKDHGSKTKWMYGASRKLLNNPFVVSQCTWNEQQQRCEIDMKYALNPYNEQGNTFQSILAHLLDCKRQSNQNSCLKEGCVWDSHNQECWRQDVASEHQSSPCSKAAPLFFDGLSGTASCKQSNDARGCNSNKDCYWNEKRKVCVFDSWHYLIGIEVLNGGIIQGTSEAKISRIGAMHEAIENKIANSSKPFDWDSILDMNVPPPPCPEGVNSLICTATNSMSALFLTDFYCARKYFNKTVRDCDADDLCTSIFTGNVHCLATSRIVREADQAFYSELYKAIENKFDRDFIQKTYTCYRATSNNTCSRQEDCLWNSETKGCRLSDAWILTQIVKPQHGMKGRDAVCQYYSDMLHSTCLDASRESCLTNKDCTWSSSLSNPLMGALPRRISNAPDFCRIKVEVIIQSWIDHDSKMSKRVETITERCSNHKSQLTCV